jgi:hypothetical protein
MRMMATDKRWRRKRKRRRRRRRRKVGVYYFITSQMGVLIFHIDQPQRPASINNEDEEENDGQDEDEDEVDEVEDEAEPGDDLISISLALQD